MSSFHNIIICLIPIFISIHLFYALSRDNSSLRKDSKNNIDEFINKNINYVLTTKEIEDKTKNNLQKKIKTSYLRVQIKKEELSEEKEEPKDLKNTDLNTGLNTGLNTDSNTNPTINLDGNIPEKNLDDDLIEEPNKESYPNKESFQHELIKLSPNNIWFLINQRNAMTSYYGNSIYFLQYITTLHEYTIISLGFDGYDIQKKIISEKGEQADVYFFNIYALPSKSDRNRFREFIQEYYKPVAKNNNVWFFRNGLEAVNEFHDLFI